MTAPIRRLPPEASLWVETEAVNTDEVRIHGEMIRVVGPQRIVDTFADRATDGYLQHHHTALYVDSDPASYSIWDDVAASATDSTPDPPPVDDPDVPDVEEPRPITGARSVALRDDLFVASGKVGRGDGVLALAPDLPLVNRPAGLAGRLLWSVDLPPAYASPYGVFGDLADEWDVSALSGSTGTNVTRVPNRVANSPIGDLVGTATPPTLTANAFGAGRHAMTFDGATQAIEAGADTTDYPMVPQPFVIAVVLQPTAADSTNRQILTGGATAPLGIPTNSTQSLLSYNNTAADGFFLFGGGSSKAVKSTWKAGYLTRPFVLVAVYDGQNSLIRINGTQISAAPSTNFGSAARRRTRLPSSTTTGFVGHVGHVLAYNGSASAINLTGLEAALIAQWGIDTTPF